MEMILYAGYCSKIRESHLIFIAFIITNEGISPETLDFRPRLKKLGFLASKNRDSFFLNLIYFFIKSLLG